MKVLSLFDGISCGRIALEAAGVKIEKYYASEIDKYAIQVTQHHYPDTIQVGDITKLKGKDFKDVDMIIGGSPCESFSIAGNGKGFDGASGLFFEYVRMLKEIKPKYFLLENVKMKSEWQTEIIRTLKSIYPDTNQYLINSNCVSAQNRNRLYWTNIRLKKDLPQYNILLRDILQKDIDKKYYLSYKAINTIKRNLKYAEQNGREQYLEHLNRGWIERIGNKGRITVKDLNQKSCTLTARMGTGGNNMPVIYQRGHGFIKNKIIQMDKWPTLCAQDPSSKHVILCDECCYTFRRLTPLECERLQTLPINYTSMLSDSRRYQVIGKGWTVEVLKNIFLQI